MPSNSFKKDYERLYPHLIYSYNDSTQIHDYSGNWDFDGDGKKDSLYFIGNGAVHLYYHLRIILSSDNKIRDFSWLVLDLPYLGTFGELQKSGNKPSLQFLVHDFDSNGIDDIFLNFDIKYSPIPKEWNKRGVSSRYILMRYKNKHIVIENFMK